MSFVYLILENAMGSYVTGAVIALCMLLGLYTMHESSTGNSIFSQDRTKSLSEDELRVLAKDSSSPEQIEVILELGERPGDLKKTVPLLAKLSIDQNPIVKLAADSSLEKIGDDAAEHIREFVDVNTTYGHRVSCSAMRAIGPACRIYMPQLRRLLEDDNPMHRKCGLYALQGMGEHGKAAMREVIICVLDEDLNNQCSACRILEKFGPDAIDAEESLLTLQKIGGPSTRGWAAICLGSIGPTDSGDITETLAKQISPGPNKRAVTPIEQQRVLMGLAYLGPEAIGAVDIVREKLYGNNKFIRGYAAYALWRITGESKESLIVLRDLLNDPDYMDAGIYVVGTMGADGVALIDEVGRGLRSAQSGRRELAVVAIGKMGPAAKSYRSRIRERLNDSDPLVKMAARRALSNIVADKDSEQLTKL